MENIIFEKYQGNGNDFIIIDSRGNEIFNNFKSKDIFDVRRLAAGKKYSIFKSKDSLQKAQYFVYQPNAIDYVVYDLRDSIQIRKGQKEVTIQVKSVGGIINSSLYETLQQQNSSPALAVKLADIFAWSIDFYRIQKGDWFKAIYEVQYVDDEGEERQTITDYSDLSDDEKAELMGTLQDTVNDLQKESEKLEATKNKTISGYTES